MPCEIRDNMIICSRGPKKPPPCQWCLRPSTKLCDFPIDKGKTCDAPMCDHHATSMGSNVDYRPKHQNKRVTF